MRTQTILFCFIVIVFASCFGKPCNRVTEKDIIGVYISLNPANKDKLYLEVLQDKRYYMLYCDEDTIIERWSTWKQIDGCRIRFNDFQWFNLPPKDTIKSTAFFNLIGEKLSIGDDDFCFKKVRHKPELHCNNQ